MNITEIKNRIAEIGERLGEISREQAQSGAELARAQGYEWGMGIDVASLTEWARRMCALNTEVAKLTSERTALRAQKRTLTPCVCVCH
jgi:uncharacterized small protein (DUF1192 family)